MGFRSREGKVAVLASRHNPSTVNKCTHFFFFFIMGGAKKNISRTRKGSRESQGRPEEEKRGGREDGGR